MHGRVHLGDPELHKRTSNPAETKELKQWVSCGWHRATQHPSHASDWGFSCNKPKETSYNVNKHAFFFGTHIIFEYFDAKSCLQELVPFLRDAP